MPGSSKNAVLVRDTYYKEPIAKHLKKHLLLVRYVHAVGIPAVDTHYELINNPFAQLLYAVLPEAASMVKLLSELYIVV